MATFPKITITLSNGALAQGIPTTDALCGLLLQGIATTEMGLLVPKKITSLADAEALGITAAYDTANTVDCYKAIKQFYTDGEAGLELWIMLVSQAVNATTMMDKTETNYAVKLLDAAQGKIRMLGLVRNPASGYVPDVAANEIDSDIVTALTNASALADAYRAQYKPVRVVMEAYAYTGTEASLLDLKTLDKNGAGLVLGNAFSGNGACIGAFLGRAASVPVQRNVGRVKDGPLKSITDAYIGTSSFADKESTVKAITNKGYITLRQHIGKAGYYFANDPTATSATDDYNKWSRCRIIDKAVYLSYATFVNEILDEVETNNSGQIETAKAKYYQTLIDTQINQQMTAAGEITSFESYVDAEQNIVSTGELCIVLRIRPKGYNNDIEIDLGYEVV